MKSATSTSNVNGDILQFILGTTSAAKKFLGSDEFLGAHYQLREEDIELQSTSKFQSSPLIKTIEIRAASIGKQDSICCFLLCSIYSCIKKSVFHFL